MPWYFLSWVLVSDIYLCQETLKRSESCKTKLRKTSSSPSVLQGWPLESVQHIVDTSPVPQSPAGPPSCCLLHFLHLFFLSVIIVMPNRSCILQLRTDQCFVCNFLCMPRCKSKIALKNVLVASQGISETC